MVTTMWARIEDGTVAEITNIDPAGRFHPSLVWVTCNSEVEPGWLYDGAAFTAPVAHAATPDEIEVALTSVLNRHLDAVAGQRRYDSRFTCALRAGFPGPFQEEGQVFAAFMDDCNMDAYQLMAKVKAGDAPVPTEAELIAALPVIAWPPSPIPAGAA
jgi:hypothetical protein